MNKKQLLKVSVIVFAILLFIGIVGWYKPFDTKDIKLSFVAESEIVEGDAYKVYYLMDGEEEFSEENSTFVDVVVGEKNEVEFTIPGNAETIRLDLGTRQTTIVISDFKVSCGEISVPVSFELFSDNNRVSGIEEIKDETGNLYVVSNSEDPFVVWDTQTFISKDEIAHSADKDNYVAKAIACVVELLLLIGFIRKYDDLVEFPVQIYQSRKLLIQLSINDFKTKYAGSYLGIIWAFVQPLITILVYWFVFGVGLRNGDVMEVPFVMWLVAGFVPWFFFSDAWNGGTGALIEYQYLVKKVVFQIDILPLVKVLSAIYVHAFFVVFTVLLYIGHGYYPDIYTIQLLYYTFCTFVLVLGLSYITSAVVGFFRDLSQIIGIFLQIGVWMTPIMWTMEGMAIPDWAAFVLKLNPMYYIVTGYRDTLISKVWFWENPTQTMYFWAVALFILGAGALLFKKLKVHFADVL